MTEHDKPQPDPPAGIEAFTTGVDLSGLMALFSQHLYSTPEVAVRELVQNAHDAIRRRAHLDGEVGSARIDVTADASTQTLAISDNGSGLTHDEIHELLATVGVGATRLLRCELATDENLIGLFGLGFLSAFVIADEVTFVTRSSQSPDEAWEYRSRDGFTYTVLPAQRDTIGTTVTLHLAAEHKRFAERHIVRRLLERYCRLLHFDIELAGHGPINLAPPWRDDTDLTDEARNQFWLAFALAFEQRFEPIASLPIDEGNDLQGALWIQGGSSYDSSDNRQLSVFVRGMLLDDNERDLLPRWAGFVSGVVESTSLTPTASREALQRDAAFDRAQAAIAETLVTGLQQLALAQPATWSRVLTRHWQALLGAALSDDRLFELVADHVELPTSHGRLTMPTVVEDGRIHVARSIARGFEEVIFLARAIPVVRGHHANVPAFLRRYAEANDLELVEIGTDAGDGSVFTSIDVDARTADWLQAELGSVGERVEPSHFEPTTVPLVVIRNHDAELKQAVESDVIARNAGQNILALARNYTTAIDDAVTARVYLNLGCPTVRRVVDAHRQQPGIAAPAMGLLRTIKNLMAMATEARSIDTDVSATFGDALALIDDLVVAPPEAPGPKDPREGESHD